MPRPATRDRRSGLQANFRARWIDNGQALIANRFETLSHIVLFDRFWLAGRARTIDDHTSTS